MEILRAGERLSDEGGTDDRAVPQDQRTRRFFREEGIGRPGDEHRVSGAQKDGEAQRGQNGLTNELEHDVYPYVKKKPEGTHAEETSGVGEERTPLQVICTDAARRGRRRKSRYQ